MIKFNDLYKQWEIVSDNVNERFKILFEKCSFIGGPDVTIFEQNFAKYIGCSHAMGVSNGTDAIKLAVESLGLDKNKKIGIIIPANTFIATIIGAEMAIPNAEFILVDCDEYYQIDINILEKTLENKRSSWDECIIIPVHLYGHSVDIINLMHLSEKYNCYVIEDSSQAHGTEAENYQKVGTFGHLSAFSLYPGKNLGAAGDAGIITTNDEKLYEKVQYLKNWGSKKKYYYECKGYNNRLDSIQAIILDEKLKYLDQWNEERNKVADKYLLGIKNPKIILPKTASYCKYNTWHVFPILTENRDEFIKYLESNQIQTNIHYPVPIELSTPYQYLGFNNPKTRYYADRLESLPIHPFMSNEEIEYVIDIINKF